MTSAILLSGGLDSTALTFLLRPELAFVVDYGQVCAAAEIVAAQAVAEEIGVPLSVIRADCRQIGSGALAGQEQLPISPSEEWWPYRNQLLATLAGGSAVRAGISRLIFGSVATDAFHADGRAEFFEALDNLFRSQEGGLRVEAPALHMTTPELIRQSKIPLRLLYWTHSCFQSYAFACGRCRGCLKHMAALDTVTGRSQGGTDSGVRGGG